VRLVSRVARRDVAALLELFDASYRFVFTLALRITTRAHIAEDLTVEVFEQIWREAASFDPEARTVIGWIMATARSMACDRLVRKPETADPGSRPHSRKKSAQDASLRRRLIVRIAAEAGRQPRMPEREPWLEPEWEAAGTGIEYKLLAVDSQRRRVSMLVRLRSGAAYPAHTHAGHEELHLLHGELWIDDRKLFPGDYNHANPGTTDHLVWSATGCTCVLITSTEDALL